MLIDERVSPSLGRVLDDGGNPVGTCFQVTPGVVVTAWHVLEMLGAGSVGAKVRADPLQGGVPRDMRVARVDPLHDLAVLDTADPLADCVRGVAPSNAVTVTTPVVITGVAEVPDPGHFYRHLDADGHWAGGTVRDNRILLGRVASKSVMKGMSGAPVLAGQMVVGVVCARYNSDDGWGRDSVWVARTEDLTSLLAEAGVDPHRAGTVPAGGQAPAVPSWGRPGRPVREFTDPLALEVHPAIEVPDTVLPLLPQYVPREHDHLLKERVANAARGVSTIAVLVGGSSTGKTRACWEALQLLRDHPDEWWLWHPIDPTRPDAALRDLRSIGSCTVVWLDETQFYLNAVDGLGERIAAGLRELLRDSARAPVLVLGSMWPGYWDELTTAQGHRGRPDLHAQARKLLEGHTISVPDAFTGLELAALRGSQGRDPRLAKAAEYAEDGRVTQYLAGVPALIARYRNAPPAARAVIDAAVDARRLGYGLALPRALLADAAPGYLIDAEWDTLGEDWLEQAIAYTSAPCNGVRGPVTPMRPRSGPSLVGPDAEAEGPQYRLADYLEQAGRHDRREQLPPVTFWNAVTSHAISHELLLDLAMTAERCGLYRTAACLWGKAAASGHPAAAVEFFKLIHRLDPDATSQVGRWVAERVTVDSPREVIPLLMELHRSGASQAVTTLGDRCAARAVLTDVAASGRLMAVLRIVGAHQAATVLADRDPAKTTEWYGVGSITWIIRELGKAGIRYGTGPWRELECAGDAVLYNPDRLYVSVLEALHAAHAGHAAATLALHAAQHAYLGISSYIENLLRTLRRIGAMQAAAVLIERTVMTVASSSLDDRGWFDATELAEWLGDLPTLAADQTATALASRVPLNRLHRVMPALAALWKTGKSQAVTILADRIIQNVHEASFDSYRELYGVLCCLRESRADRAVSALAECAAMQCPLKDAKEVVLLLRVLRLAGAREAIKILLRRDPAGQVSLQSDSACLVQLLKELRSVGAESAIAVLLERDPARHMPADSHSLGYLIEGFKEFGDEHARILIDRAVETDLDNPGQVADMLTALRRAGATSDIRRLLERDPAQHVTFNSPRLADLLKTLRELEADAAITRLLARDPVQHIPLDGVRWDQLTYLVGELRAAGDDQAIARLLARAALRQPLKGMDSESAIWFLKELHAAGNGDAVTVMADRIAQEMTLSDHRMMFQPSGLREVLQAFYKVGANRAAFVLLYRAANSCVPLDLWLPPQKGEYYPRDWYTFFIEATVAPSAARQFLRFGREADGTLSPRWNWADIVNDNVGNTRQGETRPAPIALTGTVQKWPDGWPCDFPELEPPF